MSIYRVTVTEARGSITHYTLKRSTFSGATREVESMRGGHWRSAILEVYELSRSEWRQTSTSWNWETLSSD